MTNIESHKSVAVELPTFRVLKAVADKEFRTPSKQIAFLIATHYPDIWEEFVEMEPDDTNNIAPSTSVVLPFVHDQVPTDTRSQYRTWQVLICLYKNRSLGALSTSQLAQAIGYTFNLSSISTSLSKPRDIGLISSSPISSGGRDLEWKLTDFGNFVAKDLNENIPVRLTGVILDQYQSKFLKVAS